MEAVARRYPWLYEPYQDCILSPDCDGLLCGLMMSHFLSWKVRGFYDGKVLVCSRNVDPANCIFLDMEIYREQVRSVGQHMLLYNRNRPPNNWNEFDNCFAINNLRGHDGSHDFALKYPFGTIHFLIVALNAKIPIYLTEQSISPLLFTDGTYHNLFRYTENSYNWLHYLRCDEDGNPLRIVFDNQQHTIHSLMTMMMEFWKARDAISSIRGQRADRVAITRRGGVGDAFNLEEDDNGFYRFIPEPKDRAEAFLRLLADRMGWLYCSDDWSWQGWRKFQFTKETVENMTIDGFDELTARRPLSFAMTAGRRYEYTIEEPDTAF